MTTFNIKPRRSFAAWFKFGLAALVIVLVFLGYVLWQFARPAGRGGELAALTVNSGESVKGIGAKLLESNLIHSRFWFESWVWLTQTESRFIAGEYRLPRNINIINAVRLLTGAVSKQVEFTVRIVEGWTVSQMADYLEDSGLVPANEFIQTVIEPRSVAGLLTQVDTKVFASKPASASLEGYLFPDTYRLYLNASVEDLVMKMLENFARKFPPVWQEVIQQRGHTVHEALTLASIVEREVATDKDRALVADIFWRRLEAGRGLEADSTINYITGKKSPAASAEDLVLDSPYNTYRYKGLPPGPISNPGEASLRAVVYPEVNSYWYFLSTPDGQVIYSETFEQHKSAKEKYLR
ncbi:MAG: endolytic transglycosylase MltG [Candidatus Veblenbacteria bacterium]|nr:endolytic transglycosylase MltG [Candidatus Veblenbacteria bacterium]